MRHYFRYLGRFSTGLDSLYFILFMLRLKVHLKGNVHSDLGVQVQNNESQLMVDRDSLKNSLSRGQLLFSVSSSYACKLVASC